MQGRAHNAPYKQIRDSQEFYLVRAKLRVMESTPQDAMAEFETQLRERRFAHESAVWYGMSRAQLRQGNFPEAEKSLLQARKLASANPMFETLAAEIKMAEKEIGAATAIYREGYKRYPNDEAIMLGLVNALQLQAQSYAALGKSVQSRRATAEAYALNGQTQAAVEQLELAQREARQFQEQSMIDSRLRILRAQVLEERKAANQSPF